MDRDTEALMERVDALKEQVCAEVDRRAELLVVASHRIHAHPELAYEERFAHELLTEILATEGLTPQRHAYGTDTGFSAEVGDGDGPVVAVMCEYDALPGVGHACGHNVIATAGLGAGLAAAAVAGEAGGRLRILGTPAEEGGGGKILMAEHGALDGLDAAVMVHPADADLLRMDTIAVRQLYARYEGRAAHAAAAPWDGRNALDAAVLGYVNVAALRQHIHPGERIHGVFTKAGDRPNIVPREAEAHWYIRSPTATGLQALEPRVVACLEAGAAATGCSCGIDWVPRPYAEMRDNSVLLAAYAANAARLGRPPAVPEAGHAVVGSTDMGNVSYRVPSIHPMIQVAPRGVAIHTEEFAEHAASPSGDAAVLDGAKALAMTVVDLWCRPGLAAAARAELAAAPADPLPAG